jgi:hypothetical protein
MDAHKGEQPTLKNLAHIVGLDTTPIARIPSDGFSIKGVEKPVYFFSIKARAVNIDPIKIAIPESGLFDCIIVIIRDCVADEVELHGVVVLEVSIYNN